MQGGGRKLSHTFAPKVVAQGGSSRPMQRFIVNTPFYYLRPYELVGTPYKNTSTMKRLGLVIVALGCMVSVQAQELAEVVAQSKDRAQKLQELVDSKPKESGLTSIDNFAAATYVGANAAIENSTKLQNFYKREIGETVDGVTDVTVTKPTLDDWLELSNGINAEVEAVKAAGEQVSGVTSDLEALSSEAASAPITQKAKLLKQVKSGTNVVNSAKSILSILGEESSAQASAISQIISTLKSGGNL